MTAPKKSTNLTTQETSVPNGTTGPRDPVAVPRDAVWIAARQVRDRFGGRSAMWLHRRLKCDPTFPRPTYFGRLMFFRVADVDAWANQQTKN